ncbi:hypothetical protein [Pseudomonas sp. RIT411]|uniref:hypothetical protein n=1 Tax=Pseudomonas sp. RIT411 TaxID=2202160 RepID=UPI000D3A3D25|nr:hypothetical protein [Pseudomonas sp. RIT 411]RAU36352.1 hypothetical protein DBY63_017150 [Pseudomonas sp. RIT 411]
MKAPEAQCLFLSRGDAERFRPAAGSHLVSISDGPEDPAAIDENHWESVSYHHFIDAGFDEETIALYGSNFERTFRDYLLMPKAEELRTRLDTLAAQRVFVVINCQAGRSRSAAAAAYLRDRHGYHLEKPTPDANMCVLRMLSRDASLMAAYREASRQTESEPAPGGFLSAIRSLLSRL